MHDAAATSSMRARRARTSWHIVMLHYAITAKVQ
jgi:hypothetical protein